MRTVISVVVALVASIVGTLLLWYGGGHTVDALGGFDGFGPAGAGLSPLLAALGCALLALAALSVRWSRWGVIVAGALHVLSSLLAVLLPVSPGDGIVSPTIRVLNALVGVDPALATGGYYFVAFGGGLLIGVALLGVGLAARRTRPAGLARALSAVGGVLALLAAAWTFATGGDVYRRTFQMLEADAALTATFVGAALLFGAAIAPSGRSASGTWIAGGALALSGLILLAIDPVAYLGLPSEVVAVVPVLGWSGTILAVGATLLGLALGITLRPDAAPAGPDAASAPVDQEGAADTV